MGSPSNSAIVCDGCGRPASPDHIAERLARLELATRFRPIHMNVLFVAVAPMIRPEDDFYGPPNSKSYFDSLMDALEIAAPEMEPPLCDAEKLIEFQRRGFYLSYLSECPIPEESGNLAAAIPTLGSSLLLRIRFNYKPKHIALIGSRMAPLIEILEKAGMGPQLLLQDSHPLTLPNLGDLSARSGFRTGLRTGVSSDATA